MEIHTRAKCATQTDDMTLSKGDSWLCRTPLSHLRQGNVDHILKSDKKEYPSQSPVHAYFPRFRLKAMYVKLHSIAFSVTYIYGH